MTKSVAQKVGGHTLFCEDIRDEVGGSSSYIGVYNASIVHIEEFPGVVPKFALVVTLKLGGAVDKEPFDLRVIYEYEDDSSSIVLVDTKLDVDAAFEAMQKNSKSNNLSIKAVIKMSPLLVERWGTLKVRAYRHGTETKLGAIAFKYRDPTTDPPVQLHLRNMAPNNES